MALTTRFGNFQPFLRGNSREDERYGGVQAGFVTYHGEADDETYLVSYAEVGGRSDHISKPLGDVLNASIDDLSTASPLSADADLIQTAEKKEADEASA